MNELNTTYCHEKVLKDWHKDWKNTEIPTMKNWIMKMEELAVMAKLNLSD